MIELDGKPFGKLSAKEIEKYSGKWIFRCGLDFITKSNDPEIAPVTCASVHVLPTYQTHEIKDGVRHPLGELQYFENKRYQEGSKQWFYSPSFISIGYTGSIIINNDPYLAWFLDNHPYNEVVKANRDHPNYNPDTSTYFATYSKGKQVAFLEESLMLKAELVSKIFDPKQIAHSELKAIGTLILANAADIKVQHKLFSMDEMTEKELRAEMARLADQNPQAINLLMSSQRIDYLAWIHNFQDMQLIKIVGNEWIVSTPGQKDTALMKIAEGNDAMAALTDWFQKFDKSGTKFNSLKSKYEAINKGRKATA